MIYVLCIKYLFPRFQSHYLGSAHRTSIIHECLLTSYFTSVLDSIDCFEEPWVVFRGKDGKPGYVQNTCAHRACPLQFGSVNECWIQCPYHGE